MSSGNGKHYQSIRLSDDEAVTAARLSKHFAMYGKADKLNSEESNYLSILGEFAASKYFFGDIQPVYQHRLESLSGAIRTGKVRDGNRDFPDCRIDVKCSRDRRDKGWMNLHLLVPPYQYRTDTCYVCAVAIEAPSEQLDDIREIMLAGWGDFAMLKEMEQFDDWYACPVTQLYGMNVLRCSDWSV